MPESPALPVDAAPLPDQAPAAMRHAAALAVGQQQYPAGTLYIVATPIGNLGDLTLRAIHLLGLVDAVACEDTRVTSGLLSRLGLHCPLLAVHEHNEQRAAADVLLRLAAGQRVAYVSDAGTPAVSDPGARLVDAARAAGHRVLPLPGASSVSTALSVAGDATAQAQSGAYTFAGFLPPKGRARAERLDEVVATAPTTLLFEAPHRVAELAGALASRCPARRITLCRELTKQFEQIVCMPCADLPAWLAADAQHGRGEFVLVLHALPAAEASAGLAPATERLLRVLVDALPLKQAVALCAQASGAGRNELYQQALAWKQGGQGDEEADDA